MSVQMGNLLTEKNTANGSSQLKHAKHCFILYSFLNGNSSEIDIFSRSKKQKQNEINDWNESVALTPIPANDMFQTVQKRRIGQPLTS